MIGYRKNLYCIVEQTASGKDSLVNDIVASDPTHFNTICSYTSRPKRSNEENGREHYFLTEKEFNELKFLKKQNIIAYTKISKDGISGYQYMALIDELEKANIYIIDPNGLENLKENFSNKINIVSFYIYTPLDQREKRAKKRSDFDTNFWRRVIDESKQFEDFAKNHKYDYIIYNYDNNYNAALSTLYTLLQYEMYKNNDTKPLRTIEESTIKKAINIDEIRKDLATSSVVENNGMQFTILKKD